MQEDVAKWLLRVLPEARQLICEMMGPQIDEGGKGDPDCWCERSPSGAARLEVSLHRPAHTRAPAADDHPPDEAGADSGRTRPRSAIGGGAPGARGGGGRRPAFPEARPPPPPPSALPPRRYRGLARKPRLPI